MVPMCMSEDEFEKAFAEFQQFGPRRRLPIEQRWHEILPDLSPASIQQLRAHCKEIEEFAIAVASQVVYGDLAEDKAAKQILDRFPFLTETQLQRTLSQALYFASR